MFGSPKLETGPSRHPKKLRKVGGRAIVRSVRSFPCPNPNLESGS